MRHREVPAWPSSSLGSHDVDPSNASTWARGHLEDATVVPAVDVTGLTSPREAVVVGPTRVDRIVPQRRRCVQASSPIPPVPSQKPGVATIVPVMVRREFR